MTYVVNFCSRSTCCALWSRVFAKADEKEAAVTKDMTLQKNQKVLLMVKMRLDVEAGCMGLHRALSGATGANLALIIKKQIAQANVEGAVFQRIL